MLKKSKITIVLVLVASFLMNSCHKEEELESADKQIVIKKRNISFEELNTKLNKYKKYKVHQRRAGGDEFITSLETDNIVEIETEVKTTYTLKANTTADDTTNFTNIIFVEKNGELEKHLLRYEPTEAWKNARLTDENISYSGNTIILDFDGTILAESQVVDGITVSKASASMTCYEIEWYSDVIHLESYIIIVEIPCDEPEDGEIDAGDSGDGGGTNVDTSGDGDGGSTTSGTGTDGNNSNDNGTGNNTDNGNDGDPIFTEPVFGDNDGDEDLMAQLNALLCDPINITQFNAVDIEIIHIILDYLQESNSGGCSEIDFDSLLAFPITDVASLGRCNSLLVTRTYLVKEFLEDNSFGQKVLNSFVTNPNNHISIKSVTNLELTVAAKTKYVRVTDPIDPDTGEQILGDVVTIELNANYLNQASDIRIVTTLFHELLHAYIINLYHKDLLLSTYPQYSDLNTAFINHFENPSDTDIEDTLEVEMHDIYIDFVDDLAESIRNYAIKNNIKINNNIISLNYASNLVWGSLQGQDVFTDNLTTTQQTQANTISNNELQNNNNGTQTKSCN